MGEQSTNDTRAVTMVESADGTQLAVERSGEGPPLVLVGGALSDRNGAAALAAQLPGFRIHAYDRRGRGDSSDETAATADSLAREIEDLEALIGAAGGEAFVFGMSSGAALALQAALSGAAITKLALYEPPFDDGPESPYAEDPAAQYSALIAAGRREEVVERFLTGAVRMPTQAFEQLRASPDWARFERLAHTLVYDMNILGDGTIPTERLAELKVPTLVLTGELSPPRLRESSAAVAAALPNGRLLTLPKQAHAADPAVLAPILREFFSLSP